VSWQENRPDRTIDYPLGPEAVGQLIYDDSGHVSAQPAHADQPRFPPEDWRQAQQRDGQCVAELLRVLRHLHHRSSSTSRRPPHRRSWFPNLAGTQQVRRFRFDDDRLVLDADTAWAQVRIVSERP